MDDRKGALRDARVLVIGAGGLGCELLKSLAMSGINRMDVIDLDTIDVSNLNRQFLFRRNDVGKPKAVVAADFIKKRFPHVECYAHHANIQSFPDEFYLQFNIVVAGLDSLTARSWISAKLCELANNKGVTIPLVDGGTEYFSGHVKVIIPGQTACIDCQMALFPEPVAFQICTIATTPRLPEHCVAYAMDVLWKEKFPNKALDGDKDEDIDWIVTAANEHAAKFGIESVDAQFARGVVKNIIPAIASTQSIVASACATEVIKLITKCAPPINNNLMIVSHTGINAVHFQFERNPECQICHKKIKLIPFIPDETVAMLRDRLASEYGMNRCSLSSDDGPIYLTFMSDTHCSLQNLVSLYRKTPTTKLVATSRGVKDPLEFILVDV